MVDKGDITDIIADRDHWVLLEQCSPLLEAFDTSGDSDAIVLSGQPPTAEVLSLSSNSVSDVAYPIP